MLIMEPLEIFLMNLRSNHRLAVLHIFAWFMWVGAGGLAKDQTALGNRVGGLRDLGAQLEGSFRMCLAIWSTQKSNTSEWPRTSTQLWVARDQHEEKELEMMMTKNCGAHPRATGILSDNSKVLCLSPSILRSPPSSDRIWGLLLNNNGVESSTEYQVSLGRGLSTNTRGRGRGRSFLV